MVEANIHNVLVVGIDAVSVATSAMRAGLQVYAADYFGDQDIKRVCRKSRSIIEQRVGGNCGQLSSDFNPEALLQLARELVKNNEIDGTLLSSGLDDSLDVLFELNDLLPIIGNHPLIIQKTRDKMNFFQELKRLRIPHPETAIAEDYQQAKEKARDIGYPVLVKPSSGFGGAAMRKAHNPRELKQKFPDAYVFDERVLIQKYIFGAHASVSLISATNRAINLTLNEQLLGVKEVNQEEPFGYCGNVVPQMATTEVTKRCKEIAERIALHFGLRGSNGIDFVISEEGIPHVVEVNPRFQGTLECIEQVFRINIVKAHIKACLQGILPTIMKKPERFCARLILFAPQRSMVPDLNIFKEVRNIPLPNVIVEKGEPICSIVVEAAERKTLLRKAKIITELIYTALQPQRQP